MSRFVRSYPEHVYEVEIPRQNAYAHESKYKDTTNFRDNWKWYIATIVARDRVTKVQRKANSSCPTDEAFDEGKTLIEEDVVRIHNGYDSLRKAIRKRCDAKDRNPP